MPLCLSLLTFELVHGLFNLVLMSCHPTMAVMQTCEVVVTLVTVEGFDIVW